MVEAILAKPKPYFGELQYQNAKKKRQCCCIGVMLLWHYYSLYTIGSKCIEDPNIGDDLTSLANPFFVPNLAPSLTLPNFGKRFAQPLELHFLLPFANFGNVKTFAQSLELL